MTHAFKDHYEVLIIGGGTGGITVAAKLSNRADRPEIAIIEPSAEHYYQPLWTLVGAGAAKRSQTVKPEAMFIPRGTTWIQDRVTTIDPVAQRVALAGGASVTYEQLVVAAGIQIDWTKIPGPRGVGWQAGLGRCQQLRFQYG